MRVARALALFAVSALVLSASACGPVVYAMSSFPAEASLAEAQELGAAARDPYRYYAAEAYLAKAKEEAGHGQYQDAMRFADRADSLARDAVRRLRQERPQ